VLKEAHMIIKGLHEMDLGKLCEIEKLFEK
jgi:hypothetical protein